MKALVKKILLNYYQDAIILIYILATQFFLLQTWKKPLLAAMLILAYPANFFKLRYLKSRYPVPAASKWSRRILSALRFLSSFIALPVLTLFALLPFIGNPMPSDSTINLTWLLLCGVGWWIFFDGKEKAIRNKTSKPKPEWQNGVGTLLLLIVEAGTYILLLEGMVEGESHFHVSWFAFLFLPIPFTILYFTLLLPTHLGLMMEEYLQTGSLFKTLLRRWGHFIFFRYVPVYFVYYWKG